MKRPNGFKNGIGVIIGAILGLGLSGYVFAGGSAAQPIGILSFWATPVPDSLSIERRQSPEPLIAGEPAQVAVRLQGRMGAACLGIPGQPADVMMVFDISGSAGKGAGSNWERTVTFTRQLLDHLDRPIYRRSEGPAEFSQVGLITSKTGQTGPEPELLSPLSSDYAALRARMTALESGGDTDLADGVRMAMEELRHAPAERGRAIFLFLHDSVALEAGMQQAIAEASGQEIPVYLVVNNWGIDPEKQISLDQAVQIVPAERVFRDPTPDDLAAVFLAVTHGHVEWVAAAVQVSERFEPADRVALLGVEGAGGKIETDRVRWLIDGLSAGETVELGYKMRPAAGADFVVHREMAWLDCNGYPVISAGSAFTPEVREPASTGTPAPGLEERAPEAIESESGEVSKPPAADDEAARTPVPPLFELPEGRPDGGAFFVSLGSFFSKYWGLVLLLLLLLLLFLGHRLRREPSTPPQPPSPRPSAGSPALPIGKLRPGSPQQGIDLTHGWKTQKVRDRKGRALVLRLRVNCTEGVQQALEAGHPVTLYVRVDEAGTEIAEAGLTIEPVEAPFDPAKGKRGHWYRAQLETIQVLKEHNRRCGIGHLMLEQLEAFARQLGVQQISGTLGASNAQGFFTAHEYEIQSDGKGDPRILKKLD